MSDFFWQKLNMVTGFMAIAVLFGLAAFLAGLEIKDLDLWLHLRTGQHIVEHNQIPNQDILSCSIAGKPWVNHEWLFQVIVYLVHSSWGFDGLITMQEVIVCLTLLILLIISYRSDRQVIAIFGLLMLLMIYQNRFTIRPDIYSLLFFSMQMYILSLCIERRWAPWVMGFIQVLWVNIHGFFIFGPMVALIGVFSEVIKRRVPLPFEWNSVGRLTDGEFKQLKQILVVLCLASLVNPQFIEGALYPLKVIFSSTGDSKIFFQHITELQRPLGKGTAFDLSVYSQYKIMIIVSAVTFFFNRRKIDLSVLLLWIVALWFSLSAVRNLVFFGAAAYLVIMVNSMTISMENILPMRFTNPRFKDISGIIVKCLLIFWMFNYGLQHVDHGYFDMDTFERKSEYGGVSQRSFPYHVVDFLIEQKIKGNFFNDFNSGAYLIGRTHPNIKVFIDGRTEVYGGKFFETYQKFWKEGDKEIFAELDKKCRFTGAFLNNTNQRIPPKNLRFFYGLKDWKIVYFDYEGVVFLRNIPENRRVIDKFAIDLSKWQPPPPDLERMGPKRIYPFPNIERARMLMNLKLEEPALKELEGARRIAPDAIEIYEMLGDIYGRQKKYRKAFENFRVALMYSPGNRTNRKRLAWCYERLGNHEQALKQYERLLEDDPKDDKILKKIEQLKKKPKPGNKTPKPK